MNATLVIPVPDNPQHVHNLAGIELLEAQGFTGPDRCLATALFEYGLIWHEVGDEILFVYRHPSLAGRFDRCTFAKSTDPVREWDWALRGDKAEGFFSYVGQSREEWLALPLPWQVWELFCYHGSEEIFGTSYWEGFTVSK